MSHAQDDLESAIEQTRADGHALEDTLKTESRSLATSGRKLHGAIAKAAEYQSAEVTRNRSLLSELDARGDYYQTLKADIERVILENSRQRRIVAAALRGAIAGQAAVDADLTRGSDE